MEYVRSAQQYYAGVAGRYPDESHLAHFEALEQAPEGLTSPVASIRYRAMLPALELAKSGVDSHFLVVPPLGGADGPVTTGVDADVLVIGKSFNRRNEEIAQRARSAGTCIVFDICDNHFDTPQYAAHYRALASLAHRITTPTKAMAEAVLQHTGRTAIVIPDPVEGHRASPAPDTSSWGAPRNWLQRTFQRGAGKASAAPPLRLFWFGHPASLASLRAFVPQLAEVTRHGPVQLRLATQTGPEAQSVCDALTEHEIASEVIPWSLAAMRASFDWCQLVIIPADIGSPRANVKSANRLVESLWSGRYVVASPISAYLDYSDYAWGDQDLARGSVWAMQHPAAVAQQLVRAQECIARELSTIAVAAQWMAVISQAERGADANSPSSLRLNLGCGDKPMPGYINVDVAPSRRGKQPDVLADLRTHLPFPDNCADELIAIHVIEHFWRWEVAGVVRKWMRVLKPGGRLVLECPNLISACEAFLANPAARAQPDMRGQTSMWVFYGDPQWQDPLMVHRWGYTPASLSDLMCEAGLVDARQEAAQFKLREPRDMRIVAIKPLSAQSSPHA